MTSVKQISPWLLIVGIALIYLFFPTRVYYWDGIVFAQAIEDASRLNASLVHPNHLIYNFVGYLFYKLLRAFRADLRALTVLQVLISLLSAGCAGMLLVILRETLRSAYASVCLTLLFAFSATWWKFSTDANAYIPSVLCLLLSFYLVLPVRKPRPAVLAVTFFLGMAFHQLAVLMFPVFALGIYWQDDSLSRKQRIVNVTYFALIAFVLIATAYTSLFYLATDSFSVGRLLRWTASYSPDADTKFHFWSNLQYSVRGQVRLFFGGRFNLLKGLMNPLIVVLIVCLAGTVLWVIFNLLRNLTKPVLRLQPSQKRLLLLSLLWTGIYLTFLFFFLPQNTFYRLFYLPALILLLGIAVPPRSSTFAAFVIAVALANFLFLIYPFSHVEKYPPLTFALQLNREWPGGTVVYYALNNSDAALIRYFTPSTQWKQLKGTPEDGAWLETTAIDQISSTAEGKEWLETHVRKDSLRELSDSAYKIRFIQLATH